VITIKIVGQINVEDNIPEFMMVEESKNDKVVDVISKMHENYKIPKTKYSENLKRQASPFTGLLVSKNEDVVGLFEAGGYEPLPDMDQKVKDGDKIFFVLPAAGG